MDRLSFDDEDDDPLDDWNSSEIKGFTFNDDDDSTPFADLDSYRSGSILNNIYSAVNEDKKLDVIAFESTSKHPISERVKRAAFSNQNSCTNFSSELSLLSMTAPDKSSSSALQRQIDKVKMSQFTPLHPKESIKAILEDKKYSLEFYKSFELKKELLDAALNVGDGNAILAVVIFLRKSLSKSKLYELLLTRPRAAHHLILYLENKKETSDLFSLLSVMGRYEEAAVLHYKSVYSLDSLEQRIKKLKAIHSSRLHFDEHSDLIVDTINLYDRTSAILASPQIKGLPLTRNNSVLSLLYFVSLHFWTLPQNLLYSPVAIQKMHKLSSLQFVWTGIRARAEQKAWSDVKALTISKGWMRGTKLVAGNPLSIVRFLNEKEIPKEELVDYLNFVEPMEDRLRVAHQIDVHSVIVESYISLKDRLGLIAYRDKCIPRSDKWFKAELAINSPKNNWKN